MDNPGWSACIDLHDTPKQEAAFTPVKIDPEQDAWIHYWVQKNIVSSIIKK